MSVGTKHSFPCPMQAHLEIDPFDLVLGNLDVDLGHLAQVGLHKLHLFIIEATNSSQGDALWCRQYRNIDGDLRLGGEKFSF